MAVIANTEQRRAIAATPVVPCRHDGLLAECRQSRRCNVQLARSSPPQWQSVDVVPAIGLAQSAPAAYQSMRSACRIGVNQSSW